MYRSIFILLMLMAGCKSAPVTSKPAPSAEAVSGLSSPTVNNDVHAEVTPPTGWAADPLKSSNQHAHQVWISPSRNTAYGVIYFTLPWPVGNDLVLWGFINHMKADEGEATLISKAADDALPGIRFVAEGGLYRIRANLIVDGFKGWAIYAGTIRGKPVDETELATAVRAREQTRILNK